MTRIKYTELGNLLYTDWFTLGPNFIVRGIINTTDNIYQIVEFNTDIVDEGYCNSLRHTKDSLRQALIKAGVNFEGEIRKG